MKPAGAMGRTSRRPPVPSDSIETVPDANLLLEFAGPIDRESIATCPQLDIPARAVCPISRGEESASMPALSAVCPK